MPKLAIIAQRRGMILIEKGCNHAYAQHRQSESCATVSEFSSPARDDEPNPHHQQSGQYAKQTHVNEKVDVDELARFDPIGFEYVANHHFVDAHAVGVNKIGGESRDQQRDRKQWTSEWSQQRQRQQEYVDDQKCQQTE